MSNLKRYIHNITRASSKLEQHIWEKLKNKLEENVVFSSNVIKELRNFLPTQRHRIKPRFVLVEDTVYDMKELFEGNAFSKNAFIEAINEDNILCYLDELVQLCFDMSKGIREHALNKLTEMYKVYAPFLSNNERKRIEQIVERTASTSFLTAKCINTIKAELKELVGLSSQKFAEVVEMNVE